MIHFISILILFVRHTWLILLDLLFFLTFRFMFVCLLVSYENELFLQTALDAFFDALCQMLK
jgi:hypothetical protein